MKDLLAKLLLALLYVFVCIPLRFLRATLRRDALQLQRPADSSSYWLVRVADPDGLSYFSEASVAEGRPALREGADYQTERGAAWLLIPLLRGIACLHTPPRESVTGKYSAGADREVGIPDEVYTLW